MSASAFAEGPVAPPKSSPEAVPAESHDAPEYRLNYGDVLEFSVRGFPELRQKATIELDGEVTLPLAGRVRVVGLPLSAAQNMIKSLATPRPLHQRYPDGREAYVALSLDDVLVTIAEYRPIYVMGDVGKPGELPYRPGMTARQAIALGGGFDIMRYRLVNPFTESADLKGQHEVLWTDAARLRAGLKRIEAELDGKSELDSGILKDIPLDKIYLDEILETEKETLKRRLADHAKEIEHMRGLIEQNLSKVDNLKKQLATEIEGMNADSEELDQVKEYHRRGNLPLMRMMEIRRVQLANATRVLQTRVQYDQAERDLAEARRNLERLHHNYRTALLSERQEQSAAYAGLVAKISANAEKLTHTSLLKSRLVRGRGARARIAIHRSLLDVKKTIVGSEDTPLYPGDTVEIALENEHDVDDLMRRGMAGEKSSVPPAPSSTAQTEPEPSSLERRTELGP